MRSTNYASVIASLAFVLACSPGQEAPPGAGPGRSGEALRVGGAPGSVGVYVSRRLGAPERWTAELTAANGGWRTDRHPRQLADVDGDGKQDLVGFGEHGVIVALSTGGGFAPAAMWLDDFGPSRGWQLDRHLRALADLNGDGRADVVGFGENGVIVALSTGSGFAPAQLWLDAFGAAGEGGWRLDRHPRFLADMNGDRRADVVGFGENAVFVALSTGTGLGPAEAWTWDYGAGQGWRSDRHLRALADVDGDGRADVVGFGENGVIVARSTGSGLETPSVWCWNFAVAQGWSLAQYPRALADVDGDGRADVVGFGAYGVAVGRSTGSGFAPAELWTDEYADAHGWRGDRHLRLLADVDGDHRADVVGFGEYGVSSARSTGSRFVPSGLGVGEFGSASGWRPDQQLRFLGDVDGDGGADVVGVGVATSLFPQRRLDQLTWVTAHNAFANGDDARATVTNQSHGLRWQLEQGVRALQLDVHHWDPPGWLCAVRLGRDCPPPGAYLCHGDCSSILQIGQAFAPQPLAGALAIVRDFLEQHPGELVTLFLEDSASAGDLEAAFSQVDRLDRLIFDPEAPGWAVKQRGWPTWRALAGAGRRLLVFTDSPDHDNIHGMQYDEQYTVQNTWSLGQDGGDYGCRSRWGDVVPLDTRDDGFERLFLMSHFRDVASPGNAARDNSWANLERRIYGDCWPAAGRLPNFVSVDFFEAPGMTARAIVDEVDATR